MMKIWNSDDPWRSREQIIENYIRTAKNRAKLSKDYIQPIIEELRNYEDRDLESRRSFNIRDAKEEKIL